MNTSKALSLVYSLLLAASAAISAEVIERTEFNRSTGEEKNVLVVRKPVDKMSSFLQGAAEEGVEIGSLTILVPQFDREGKPVCYLKYKLDRCFVKSWSTSGDADDRPTEEVAFYYNKISFSYAEEETDKNTLIIFTPTSVE